MAPLNLVCDLSRSVDSNLGSDQELDAMLAQTLEMKHRVIFASEILNSWNGMSCLPASK